MEEKMLDLKFVRENPDIVKQNIKNKFQDRKLHLVDDVFELDAQGRATDWCFNGTGQEGRS